jgi:hypothetical protein
MPLPQLTQAALDALQEGEITGSPASNGEGDDSSMGDYNFLDNSPMRELLGLDASSNEDTPPLPSKRKREEAQEDEEDDSSQSAPEEESSDEESDEESDDSDEETTDEVEEGTIAEEDFDWDAKVSIKVGDKGEVVSLSDLRDLHLQKAVLSAQASDIKTAAKQLLQEREKSTQDMLAVTGVLHEELMAKENAIAVNYKQLKTEFEEAKQKGDTYLSRELRDKMAEVQEEYWTTRREREAKVSKAAEQFAAQQQEQTQKMLSKFQTDISDMVAKKQLPKFDDNLAKSLRQFALDEGLSAELVDNIYDAQVIKVMNDYRTLKMSLAKGQVKREKVTSMKKIPLKTGVRSNPEKAKLEKSVKTRQKVLSGAANPDEQSTFLKSIIRHKF